MAQPPLHLFAVVLGLLAAAACSPVRIEEAAKVLSDIDAGPGPSALKRATEPPDRRPLAFEIDGRRHLGDLYVPADGARAGMVVVPGLSPDGKDDTRLVAFAGTFARAGFEVLVPDIAGMRALQVSAADSRIIADAALYLESRAAGRPLGITAISFAVGPVVLALLEPGVDARADVVVAVGGYYDIEAVLAFVTTGSFREGPAAPWRRRIPNEYGKWVFVASNAPRLADPGDRSVLAAMAERKLADPAADIADLVAGLGPEGKAVYALLTNDDPDRVPALVQGLPATVAAEIAALDLKSRDLGALTTKFVLVHGLDDPVIPETESMALAAALPDDHANLYLLDSLDHVDPKPAGLSDKLKLLDAIYKVLAVRDEKPNQ